jgi:hypothetical protein
MSTIEIRVAASADDAEVYAFAGTTWTIGVTDAGEYVGYFDSNYNHAGTGLRFAGVNVPPGATITAAYLAITAAAVGNTNTTVNSYITGDKELDAAAFSTIADYQARRGTACGGANNNLRTTAQVAWDGIPAWVTNSVYNSPDISSIIQEIINQSGWARNNHLALFWDDHEVRGTQSAGVLRYGYSYDNSTTKCALLHIEYVTKKSLTAKIGLLVAYFDKVFTHGAIHNFTESTKVNAGLLISSIKKSVAKLPIAVKVGDKAVGISKNIKVYRNILPKIGELSSAITKASIKRSLATTKIGLKVISIARSIAKIAIAKVGLKTFAASKKVGKFAVAKMGLLALALRKMRGAYLLAKIGLLASAAQKTASLARIILAKVGDKASKYRNITTRRNLAGKVGQTATKVLKRIYSLAAKIGLVLPKINITKILSAVVGLAVTNLGKKYSAARAVNAKIGLLVASLTKITHFLFYFSAKDGLLLTTFKKAISLRLQAAEGIKVVKLSFTTLAKVLATKIGIAATSLQKTAVIGRKISAKIGSIVYQFFRGRLNIINIPVLLGLQASFSRIARIIKAVKAYAGLVASIRISHIVLLAAKLGLLIVSFIKQAAVKKIFSASEGLLSSLAKIFTKGALFIIKIGLAAGIINAGFKKIFSSLLGLKQLLQHFRKVYGYRVLKFIMKKYQLLFKEEEEE